MATCKGIFIVGAKRTPFCGYGGPLRELPASHAFAAAAKDAMYTANLDPTLVDNTVVGNVNFLSQCDGGKTSRYCGALSGAPIESPALGVNKACGTGLQAVINGSMDILVGSSKICLTGGTEIMSSLPLFVRNVRFGTALGSKYHLEDHIKKQFPDSYSGKTIQKLAEDLAIRYQIKREDIDDFALQSHLKWHKAQESNIFATEVTSLTVNLKRKQVTIDKDELPQPVRSFKDLCDLSPILDDGNLLTSGNSAGPGDGAAALILASETALNNHNLRPLVRVAGWACVGVDPEDTGIGAVAAVRKLLETASMKTDDVDLFEINETFASEVLITAKELKLDLSKINVNGGALALGHPVAATGARMATHLVHELSRRKLKRALAASSCGGGQGIAVLLESV